jgi:hypothetical protein
VAVPELLNSIEQSGLSSWLRGSDSWFGFYFVLLVHTLGLALLVGSNVVVDACILGIAPGLPLESLKRLFGVMWVGFGLNVASGLLLLVAYPTKSFTNPVFYVKLTLITLAMITTQRIKTQVFNGRLTEPEMMGKGKSMAKWSLALWIMSITAGRLLAYTYTYVLYGVTAVLVFPFPG